MKYIFRTQIFLILLVLGCSKSPEPQSGAPSATQTAQAPAAVDKSTLGSIFGTISFKGAAPKLPALDLSADPACPPDPQPQDVIVIKNGHLANVFVYIKSGLPKGSYPLPAQPAVLDQKGCRYVPHVMGLMVGQRFEVRNSDNAEHNVHPMPKHNSEWNESQNPHGQPIVKTFQHPEMMMPVQCNQHPWMEMYVNVLEHPFFAVSNEDGSFQIKDLPPGEYTVTAVHEKFGEQSMQVTVAPKQSASAHFAFSGAAK